MKNLKKIVSGTLLTGILVVTGITAFASTGSTPNQEVINRQTQVQERQFNTGFERGYSDSERAGYGFEMGHRNSRRGHHMNSRWGHRNTDGHHRNFENGERPEFTEEERFQRIEEIKVRLSEALAAGNISQEEYNKAIEDINAGLRPMFSGDGYYNNHGHHRSRGFGHRGNCHFGFENSTYQTPNQPAAIK